MKKIFETKKELVIELCIIFGVIAVIGICLLFMKQTPSYEDKSTTTTTTAPTKSNDPLTKTEVIGIVPTMYDTLTEDATWAPTFELIWQDLKNNYVKQDIRWEGHPTIVDNLNKGYFKQNMIGDSYLYKVADYKTIDLKEKIKKGIKDKFNQESDVIDQIDWSEDSLDHGPGQERRLLFYSMLYREFEYMYPLDELDKAAFKNIEKVRYFGISQNSESNLRDQVDVLYYGENDYMVKINTKNGDELYFVYKPVGFTFNEIWTNANKKAKDYKGNKKFTAYDYLKIPYLDFDVVREYSELQDHIFYNVDQTEYFIIAKALQSVKLQLDNKGGKVKSEAVMDTRNGITSVGKEPEHRYFYYNDTFAVFIKEKGKEVPYFAARVEDIYKFQKEAE